MKTLSIFLVLALTSSPMPKGNYNSWISPQIAMEVKELVLNGEYREYLDFNGDGELSMADVVGIEKRYHDNCLYGNCITLDRDIVNAIAMENYTEDLIYYEVYRVDGNLCREYELAVDQITQAEIYMEFEDFADSITVELNPFEETVSVKGA